MNGLDYIDETGAKSSMEDSAANFELSESQQEYLGELEISPAEWREMTDNEKTEAVRDIRDRLEEIGADNVLEQDKAIQETFAPEILGEFRQQVFQEKTEQLDKLENAAPLSLEELKSECPELYEQVQRMDSRLGNDNPEGIMNTMQYAKLENGDFVAYSTHEAYSNSRMVYSDGIVYAKSGGSRDGDNNLDEFINTPVLMPDTAYIIDGRSVYETDSQGREIKESTVYTSDFDVKLERATVNQAMIRNGKDGIENDESSHTVPKCLGGPNEAINQTPMRSDINHGEGSEWADAERKLAAATENGETSFVEHNFHYEGDSKRPSSVDCTSKIGSEEPVSLSFDNCETEKFYSQKTSCDVQMFSDISHNKVEAPTDIEQIENISDVLSDCKALEFEEWGKLETSEKIEVLDSLERKIAEIEKRPSCPISAKVMGEGVLGGYNTETKHIDLNESMIEASGQDYVMYSEVIDTLIHEGRHAYQDYNVNVNEVHPRHSEVESWADTMGGGKWEYWGDTSSLLGQRLYEQQSIEIDARNFAADVMDKFHEKQFV